MSKDRRIILNRIKTPDGTMITSKHRHDYVTYVDDNGLEYMVDGGRDYLRRNVHRTPRNFFQRIFDKIFGYKDPLAYTEMTVYSDEPFEVIRQYLLRGGRGKDGEQPLTWVPICSMSLSWLKECIKYCKERGYTPQNSFDVAMYQKEIDYRKKLKENAKVKK